MDSRTFLKVKLKSLAAEARIIKQEEVRCQDPDFRTRLTEHRKNVVRTEARATHLAYGFLNGKKYREVESHNRKESKIADWAKVESMVRKYGPDRPWIQRQPELEAWHEEALVGLPG